MLTPVLVTPPAKPPLTPEDVRAFLRLNEGEDGPTVDALIAAATSYLDGYSGILGRCLITQIWKVNLCSWPAGQIDLPFLPVQSVSSVKYWSTTQLTLADTNYRLHANGVHPYIDWTQTVSFPSYDIRDDAIEVQFVCGYGPDPKDVPAAICHAMLMMISHWYENRETVVVGNMAAIEVPLASAALLAPFRRVGF